MFDSTTFKTVEEIEKFYNDHIESLELSGIPFDRNGIEAQRDYTISVLINNMV